MVPMETEVCEFGKPAIDFTLAGIDGKTWTLADCTGERATLVMFICNHCPYVKAIQERLVRDTSDLLGYGVKSVAIMPNDPTDYPEDSFENMKIVAAKFDYSFPYLFDETQETARAYGAVCTPDFFGYNAALELQYRGRLDASGIKPASPDAQHDLFEAIKQIAESGEGPKEQFPSMGCSIKWKHETQ